MEALFIGQTYIDVTFLIDRLPTGDEKAVARDYAVSFGGNAVSAAFCCAKLGVVPDLMASQADDWLARMFLDMAAKYGISVHGRKVRESSLSFVMPNRGMRAIIRCRDDHFIHPVPPLDLTGCRALHLDGHQPDAAIHYAKRCREAGILAPAALCDLLRRKGVRVGGVTLGDHGLVWTEESGGIRHMPALAVPKDEVIDTNGAGDIFHGAYVYSYLSGPEKPWDEHFRFARAASAHSVRFLGIENSLPTEDEVRAAEREFREAA
jgi:sugar/nucleoside kinase (ribokinase family)